MFDEANIFGFRWSWGSRLTRLPPPCGAFFVIETLVWIPHSVVWRWTNRPSRSTMDTPNNITVDDPIITPTHYPSSSFPATEPSIQSLPRDFWPPTCFIDRHRNRRHGITEWFPDIKINFAVVPRKGFAQDVLMIIKIRILQGHF